jgi:endo-1,4-beta-xylanase
MRNTIFSLLFSVLLGFQHITFAQETGETKPSKPTESVAIHGTVKVDGEIDDAWKDVPELEVAKICVSETSIAESKVAKATVKLMWDQDNLYALLHVKDSKLSDASSNDYEQDSIELFVDEKNQKAGSYQEDDAQYRVSYKGKVSGGGNGYSESKIKAVAKEVEGGYLVELSIKLEHAKKEAGSELGIELQVNDDPGHGSRAGVRKWNHAENDSYLDTKNFGTVTLK